MTKSEDLAIRTELAAVEATVRRAKDLKDREALAIALERRDRIARSAGAEFLMRRRSPKDRLDVNGAQVARMIRFCALDDDAFEAALAANIKRTVASVGHAPPYNSPPCSRIKTVISRWTMDENGFLSRTVTATDDASETAAETSNLNAAEQ
jgi:hypothetical protein